MKILIAEDEYPAYNRLKKMIADIEPNAEFYDQIDSLSELRNWLMSHNNPDLAIFDIQLSDGSTFELLDNTPLNFPIIFTTAYNEYALKAYNAITIDYLLKPVNKEALEKAFTKLSQMQDCFKKVTEQEQLPEKAKRFIIKIGQQIKTLATEDIAYFYSKNKSTLAKTFDNINYPIEYNLEELSKLLDADIFYKINRQFIINIKAIKEMKNYSKSRIIITLTPDSEEHPVVSADKTKEFKSWLGI